jgi:hypothetical protein
VHYLSEIFGPDSDELARADAADPQTPAIRTVTTAVNSPGNETPHSALSAITDPKTSAIFWIALAGVLGLVLVTGQVRFEAAAASRVGRRG